VKEEEIRDCKDGSNPESSQKGSIFMNRNPSQDSRCLLLTGSSFPLFIEAA